MNRYLTYVLVSKQNNSNSASSSLSVSDLGTSIGCRLLALVISNISAYKHQNLRYFSKSVHATLPDIYLFKITQNCYSYLRTPAQDRIVEVLSHLQSRSSAEMDHLAPEQLP